MKQRLAWGLALTLAALTPVGCGKEKVSPQVAAQQLEKSFHKADATTRQDVQQVTSALQAGDYTRAIVTMDRIAQTRPVDAAQKQAVGTLIQQTRQAAQQNPKLNTPELYKAMSDLIVRVHGEN